MGSVAVVVYAFVGASALCFGFAAVFAFATNRFLATGVHVHGTVVEIVRHRNAYRPIVEFAGPAGTQRFKDPVGLARGFGFKVGERCPVVYDAAKPDRPRIATPLRLWVPTAVLLLLGSVFGTTGALLARFG